MTGGETEKSKRKKYESRSKGNKGEGRENGRIEKKEKRKEEERIGEKGKRKLSGEKLVYNKKVKK